MWYVYERGHEFLLVCRWAWILISLFNDRGVAFIVNDCTTWFCDDDTKKRIRTKLIVSLAFAIFKINKVQLFYMC